MPRPQSRTQLSNKPNSSAASSNPISAWLARREERKQAQANQKRENHDRPAVIADPAVNPLKHIDKEEVDRIKHLHILPELKAEMKIIRS